MVDAPEMDFYWKGAAGMADVEGEIPMEPDTPFRTSGITNMMMGALALKLAEEGMLGLDDPISQYLDAEIIDQLNGPDGEPYGEAITVRQLLNGTGGNASYFIAGEEDMDRNNSSDFTEIISKDPDKAWTPEEIIAYTTGNLEAVSAPGEGFVPNDLGYVLLGLVVEAATGENLGEAYQTWLFEPLGMGQTFMVQPGDSRLEEVAHVYAIKGVDVTNFASLSWFRGDVVSTVDDLNRFMRAWADDEIFSDPGSMEAMTEWVSMADAGFPAYSCGLGVMQTDFNEWGMPEVDVVFGHPSIWNGFLFYWPKHNITFTGTINQVFPLSQYGDLSGQALGNLLEHVAEK
jgi:D-alanyl-D-alanine carboxypeptidase